MGRKKVKWFIAPGSKISSISLKNLERMRGREETGGVIGQPGARESGGRQREKIKNEKKGFEDEGGESAALADGG